MRIIQMLITILLTTMPVWAYREQTEWDKISRLLKDLGPCILVFGAPVIIGLAIILPIKLIGAAIRGAAKLGENLRQEEPDDTKPTKEKILDALEEE